MAEWLREQHDTWQQEEAAAAAATAAAAEEQHPCAAAEPTDDEWGTGAGEAGDDWDLETLAALPEATGRPEGEAGGSCHEGGAPAAARAAQAEAALVAEMAGKIVSGEPMTERKSAFQVRMGAVGGAC